MLIISIITFTASIIAMMMSRSDALSFEESLNCKLWGIFLAVISVAVMGWW